MSFCNNNPRIPTQFKVTMAGAANSSCQNCASLNGDYYPAASGPSDCSSFSASIAGQPCSFTHSHIEPTFNGQTYSLRFWINRDTELVEYLADEIADLLAQPVVLNRISGTGDCDWPDTVVAEAVVPGIADLPSLAYANPSPRPVVAPYRGILPSPTAGPFNHFPSTISPENNWAPGEPAGCSITAPSGDIADPGNGSCASEGCGCEERCGCGPAGDCADPVVNAIQRRFYEWLPTVGGPATIDFATGALRLGIAPPVGGDFDPIQLLSYSSRNTTAGENGRGVTGVLNVKAVEIDSTSVDLVDSLGEKRRFFDKDGSGVYVSSNGATSKLVKNGDNTWTETKQDGSVIKYDSTGKLTYLANPSDARWTLSYDGARVSAVLNPYGRRVTLGYDGSSKLQSILDASGRVTTFTVNGSGNLTQITTPELCTTDLVYDGSNRLQAVVNPLGYRTTYGYDANGLPSSVALASGHRATLTWIDWKTTKVQDANGNITTLGYNAARNITGIVNPLGQRATLSWANNQLATLQDGGGNTTTLTYAFLDNRVRQLREAQFPLQAPTTYTYFSSGLLEVITSPQGGTTTYVWNNPGQVLSAQGPVLNLVSTSYDALGRPGNVFCSGEILGDTCAPEAPPVWRATATLSGCECGSASFDMNYEPSLRRWTASFQCGAGNTIWVVVWDRQSEDPIFEAMGGPSGSGCYFGQYYCGSIGLDNAMNGCVPLVPDDGATPGAVTLGFGTNLSYCGCDDGPPQADHWTTITRREITSLGYDAAGNVQSITSPLGLRTTFTYLPTGQRQAVINPAGLVTTVARDGVNRLISQQNPLGQTTTYTYDLNGQRTAVTNSLGFKTTSVYDARGRIQAQLNALGNRTTLTYDGQGNRVAATNPLGQSVTSVFDAASRLIASIDPLGNRMTFGYDTAGNRQSVTNPLGYTTTTLHDAANRVTSHVNPIGAKTTSVYDQAGRQVATINPLGECTTIVFDLNSLVIATINPLGQRTTSVFDTGGRRLAAINSIGNRSTTAYDSMGRATAHVDPLGCRTTTVYDEASQPIVSISPCGHRTTTVFDNAGRQTARINALGDRTTAIFDAAGQSIASIDALGNRNTTVFDEVGRAV